MKSFIYTAITALVLAIPAAAFAQQADAPITRAQVRAELAELEQAGYNPRDWFHYPYNIQAAQERLAAERAARGR